MAINPTDSILYHLFLPFEGKKWVMGPCGVPCALWRQVWDLTFTSTPFSSRLSGSDFISQ